MTWFVEHFNLLAVESNTVSCNCKRGIHCKCLTSITTVFSSAVVNLPVMFDCEYYSKQDWTCCSVLRCPQRRYLLQCCVNVDKTFPTCYASYVKPILLEALPMGDHSYGRLFLLEALIMEGPSYYGGPSHAQHFLQKSLSMYRTRANKGRRHYSKIMFWGLRLPHKKVIKNCFLCRFYVVIWGLKT